ncbi:MAG: GNAT family N-acetyltransferase [Flavobacteriales bacterium]|nr:GNAT family N-acetyltransferase [Flavobacteriales bacterium]
MIKVNKDILSLAFPKTSRASESIDEAKKILIQKEEAEKDMTLISRFVETTSKEVIGEIILKNLDLKEASGELAYYLDKKFHNQGLMTAAILVFLNEIQGEFTHINARTLLSNLASQRVLEKIGFKYIKTVSSDFRSQDSTFDTKHFEKILN